MTSIAALPAPPLADTPLGRTIATTATDIWNDSCSIPERGLEFVAPREAPAKLDALEPQPGARVEDGRRGDLWREVGQVDVVPGDRDHADRRAGQAAAGGLAGRGQ